MFGGDKMEIVLNIIWTIVSIGLGFYILLFGRKMLWATLGIMALVATARLLAIFVADVDFGWQLIELEAWNLVGIAFIAGAVGVFLGRFKPDTAINFIGFIAGADIILWFYEISSHLIIEVARLTEQIALVIGLLLLFLGGVMGLWLIRKYQDELLIIMSMLVGIQLIQDGFRLDGQSSLTAIIIITLALIGVLVQYADFLREMEAKTPLIVSEEAASSLDFFQSLEIDEE
jgi:hypothetical protein